MRAWFRPHVDHERLVRLEGRMDALHAEHEAFATETRREAARQAQEVAVVRESHRIFEDLLTSVQAVQGRIAADVSSVKIALLEHIAKEGRDKTQMLVAVVTAALSGLGSLAVIGWGVYQVLQRMG